MTADDLERAAAILDGWRQIEQAATRGPWEAEDNEACWKLFGAATPRLHPLQLIKAPKRDTPYAEYWPGEADSAFIAASRAIVPALLAIAGGVLERHVRRDRPVIMTALCDAHSGAWVRRGFGEADRRAMIRACADCTVTEKYVCARCRHECPDDDEWPCAEVRAVVAVLLGA